MKTISGTYNRRAIAIHSETKTIKFIRMKHTLTLREIRSICIKKCKQTAETRKAEYIGVTRESDNL